MTEFQLSLVDSKHVKKRLNDIKKSKANIVRSIIISIKFDKANGMKSFFSFVFQACRGMQSTLKDICCNSELIKVLREASVHSAFFFLGILSLHIINVIAYA